MASRTESRGLSEVSDDRISIKKGQDEVNENGECLFTNKIRSAHCGTHKKKLHPLLLGPSRREQGKYVPLQVASKNNLSEFTQRIMSAKLLRVKQVQNQLSETQIQLNELINENRILKTLQKRQEGALKKYEGNHAELPQLIRSHNEEIRALKASNKLIKSQLKESNTKLKERENELESLKESYNKLKKLSSEKNLLEREKLQKKVEELQQLVKDQDEKIQVLSRKLLLESKNYRHHMNIEINKHKETQKDLNNALSMITRLESQMLAKDKSSWISGAFGKAPQKRDMKNLMSNASNKSLGGQAASLNAENDPRQEDPKDKNDKNDTPDTDLELLDSIVSSDDTPTLPTQIHDALPEIKLNSSKNSVVDTLSYGRAKIIESSISKNKTYSKNPKSPPPVKKTLKLSGDVETDAKEIAEKINKNIENMDSLVQRSDLNVANSKLRLNSLYEELKTNVLRVEEEFKNKSGYKRNDGEGSEEIEISEGSFRRNAPKRKLVEEKTSEKIEDDMKGALEKMSPAHQQKFVSMSKTWNDIKDRVQEERMKVEQKMKELGVLGQNEGDDDSNSISEKWEDNVREPGEILDERLIHNPHIANVKANDGFIINELIKTDKALKRLKNESAKDRGRTKEKLHTPNKYPDNITYRTESHSAPTYLDEFQSDYQKQSLLKALKAIDVGNNGNSSSEDEEEKSPRRTQKGPDTNSRTHTPFSSNKHTKNDLINELFGPASNRLERNDRIGLDHRVGDAVKARND